MINIVLCCNHGASTGMLVESIKKAAINKKMEVIVNAHSYVDIRDIIDDADIILLGPQIKFKLKDFEKEYADKDVPFMVINALDYGRMNGENVLNEALKKLDYKDL